MTGSVTGIVVICAVVVVSLAAYLILVANAARRPGGKKRYVEPMRGLVQGGEHAGGGRSVMPHRDAQVPEGGGTPPSPEEMAQAENSRRAGHRPAGPMDL